MFAGKVHDLRHFRFGDLVGEHTALADPVVVHMQHNASRGFAVLAKKPFQHMHDELHRRVVVVEQENAIETRTLRLRLRLGDDRGPGAVLAFALALVARQAGTPLFGGIECGV